MASLTKIEGIGEKYAKPLRAEGINSVEALLEAGKTRKGRGHLAKVTKLSEKRILSWVNKADLFRVPGIGEEFSDLLEAAGVDTVKELKTRKPENLQAKIKETNEKKKLTRRTPGLKVVEKWVAGAKSLPAVVKY